MLTFIGMGLHDERGISVRGLEESRASDHIYSELYTSLMPGLSVKNLEQLLGKPVQVLSRTDIEEKAEENVLKLAKNSKVVLLVPGDSMTATTHIDLRLRVCKARHKDRSDSRSISNISSHRRHRPPKLQVRKDCYSPPRR